MARFSALFSWTAALAAVLALLPAPVPADAPKPEIPRGKGDKCVEPTEVMRRDHMKFILRHRDETMHRGIRTKKYSLAECINCHVPKAEDPARQVHVSSPKHFCSSCHTYAAVTIDCFECHSDVPQETGVAREDLVVPVHGSAPALDLEQEAARMAQAGGGAE